MNEEARETLLRQGIRYPFSNQIIFSLIMHDENRCRKLLERIFPDRPIRTVRLARDDEKNAQAKESPVNSQVETEKTILLGAFQKSVRLDVLFEDDESWHDVECQSDLKGHLPKRSRFYHGVLDSSHLKRGEDYSRLRPSYVIFLCDFDLYGLNEPVYSFSMFDAKNCLQHGDEYYTLYLNCACDEEKMPEGLRPLLTYVHTGVVSDGDDGFVRDIHRLVTELNDWKEVESIMTFEEDAKLREKWAREEGEKNGEKRGHLEDARAMKIDGVPTEKICQYTGLTREEVNAL